MLKKTLITAASIICVLVVLIVGTRAHQLAQAQATEEEPGRQQEVEEWQAAVDMWNQAEAEKAQQTSFSSEGIMQLPNTGPQTEE